MRISKRGPGRRGTLDQGCGAFTLTATAKHEEFKLKTLVEEIEGNLGFWTSIMWAMNQGIVKKSEINILLKIVNRATKPFIKICG